MTNPREDLARQLAQLSLVSIEQMREYGRTLIEKENSELGLAVNDPPETVRWHEDSSLFFRRTNEYNWAVYESTYETFEDHELARNFPGTVVVGNCRHPEPADNVEDVEGSEIPRNWRVECPTCEAIVNRPCRGKAENEVHLTRAIQATREGHMS